MPLPIPSFPPEWAAYALMIGAVAVFAIVELRAARERLKRKGR